MSIVAFIEKVESKGITVSVDDGHLKINAPKGVMTPELIAEFKGHKQKILQWFDEQVHRAIPKAPVQSSYPVSSDQRRIWLLSQDPEALKAYIMPLNLRMTGELKADLLQQAFEQLIVRHEILRTAIRLDAQNELQQFILEPLDVAFTLEHNDFSGKPNPEEHFRQRYLEMIDTPFDLGSGRLMRVALSKVGEDDHLMTVLLHHIIVDGWSLRILMNELIATYHALAGQQPTVLPPLDLQYKDFAVWQQGLSKTSEWSQQEAYWLDRFSGELPVLELPTFRKRPLRKTYSGKNIKHRYSKNFLDQLRAFSSAQGYSLFTTLMTGMNILLHRYSNQSDLIVGTPMANRPQRELEGQVGLYLNTLAIRTRFEPQSTFREVWQLVHKALTQSYANSSCPFDHWIKKLDLKVPPDRSPLFDVMVAFQDLRGLSAGAASELRISQSEKDWVTCKFDWLIEFFEEDDSLTFSIDYNTDIYDSQLVQRVISHFEALMLAAIDQPERQIDQVDFLSSEERLQLLDGFNDTRIDYPRDKTVVGLFAEQAERTPDKVAVIFETEVFTYQEIETLSNRFAHFLLTNFSIKPEELIAVEQEKSPWIIPVLLGILKVRAAYVPIDVNYPEDRKNHLRQTSNARIVVDNAFLKRFEQALPTLPSSAPQVTIHPLDLVHVMFTSGTTGNPKGVMIDHRNIVRLIKPSNYLSLNEDTVLLSTVSISFDTTNMEFWGVLANGGTLVLEPRERLMDYGNFKDVLTRNAVNTLWLTASWFEHIAETVPELFDGLKWFISGGEVVAPTYTNLLLERNPGLKIVNGYGPTENTTFSTSFLVDRQHESALPIGKPIANSTAYVLNEALMPQPIGVTGMLYVGGDGLARGYYNNEELTAAKFINDPFRKGERIYNTGDQARWRPDGNLEFFGRADQLVKIRGKFIDTTEIENRLCAIHQIRQAVALVRTLSGEKRIVAYLVCEDKVDQGEIKKRLRQSLPEYMIPNAFVFMESIPLSPNGKTDARALPNPAESREVVEEALTATETKLAAIWSEILRVEQVSRRDNFFELGGYSLTCINLTTQIAEVFDRQVTLAELYSHAVLLDLAALLDSKEKLSARSTIQSVDRNHYALTFTQKRMWMDNQVNPQSHTYTMANLFRVAGQGGAEKTLEAFKKLVERHHILRSVFPFTDDGPLQAVLPTDEAFLQIFRQSQWNAEASFDPLRFFEAQLSEPFRLTIYPPIRLAVVQVSDEECVLLLQMHHIAYDAWSIKILSEEFRHFLESDEALHPLKLQFKHYAHWQNEAFEAGAFTKQLDYWKSLLASLPARKGGSFRPSAEDVSSVLKWSLSPDLSAAVRRICDREKVEDTYLFLAVFAKAYEQVFGIDDLVCNFPFLGRNDPGLQKVVGLFYQVLVLRIRLETDAQTLIDLARDLRNQMLVSVEHLDYPFEQLADEVEGLKEHINALSFNVINQHFIDRDNGRFDRADLDIAPIDLGNEKRFRTDLTFDLFKSSEYRLECTSNASKYDQNKLQQLLDMMSRMFEEATSTNHKTAEAQTINES